VPGAYHAGAVNFAFGERTAAMLARIVDCVELASGVEQGDLFATGLNQLPGPVWNIASRRDFHEFRQLHHLRFQYQEQSIAGSLPVANRDAAR